MRPYMVDPGDAAQGGDEGPDERRESPACCLSHIGLLFQESNSEIRSSDRAKRQFGRFAAKRMRVDGQMIGNRTPGRGNSSPLSGRHSRFGIFNDCKQPTESFFYFVLSSKHWPAIERCVARDLNVMLITQWIIERETLRTLNAKSTTRSVSDNR
jgi:hypothetical protein